MVSVKEQVGYFFHSFKKEGLTFDEVSSIWTQKEEKTEDLWNFLSDDVLESKSLCRLEIKKSEEDNVI